MKRSAVLLLLVGLLVLSGCTSGARKTVAVTGTVNLDGKPLPEGLITLDGQDGIPPVVEKIKNGSFTARTTPGPKRVEIISRKKNPNPPKVVDPIIAPVAQSINTIPERYNTMTELTADISESGPNQLTFDLKSK
jgi:hypothetical protein